MREDINASKNKDLTTWKKIKLVLHYISKVFLWSIFLILVIAAVTLIIYFIDLKKNIETGKNAIPLFNAYVIISPSMEPAIKVQDAVIVMRTEPKKLKKNDIITFDSKDPRYSGITITHRIVGVEHGGTNKALFRTKGDNNNTDDSALVKGEDIYGKVILKLPKIGYIQFFLSQKYGWIIAIVLPCLAIIIYDIIKLIKTIKIATSKKSKNNKKDVPKVVDSSSFKDEKEKEHEENKINNNEKKNKNKKNKTKNEEDNKIDDDFEILKTYNNKTKKKNKKVKKESDEERYLEVLKKYSEQDKHKKGGN